MTAIWVLASVGILIGLLIHGRIQPAVLFPVWAAGYYLFGLIGQNHFLANFSNPALVTLVLLLLVSLVLERSPLLDRLSGALMKGRPGTAALRLSAFVSPLSAFLNNTAVVGAMLGMITRQKVIPASKLLIPLSYASIFGGVTTLVGTSTNLVVNSFAVGAGLAPLGMFQFAWVGVPLALVCIGMLAFCVRWLPSHENDSQASGQAYFLEARVRIDAPLVGRTIEQNHMRRLDGLFLAEIVRDGRLISPVGPNEIILAGDVLIFSGETQKVQALQAFDGLDVFGMQADRLLGANLVEIVISSESELPGQTLRDVDFRTMFDAAVVGIRRGSRQLTGQLGQIPLRIGDSLLLAVGPDFWHHRNLDRNFHVLDNSLLRPRLSSRQNLIALGGFGGVIMLSTIGALPLLNGLLILLALFLFIGLLNLADLRRRLPYELIMVIGSALGIAQALETSGAAALVADFIRESFAAYGPMGALVGVYLITLVLTELVTNNAAAALAFPVALSSAKAFGVDPTPFVMVVAYGASACFMLPFGYQTHLMVYTPGRYRLTDFLRIGLPVSLVYALCVLVLVPIVFPFSV